MAARLHWNPLPQEQQSLDANADAIVDARACTVQLGNGHLYLDAAADAEHSLLGHDKAEPIAASAAEVAAMVTSFAPGYRCLALTDGLESALAVARSIGGECAHVVDALTGYPEAITSPFVVVENRSLARSGAWLASLAWPLQPAVIVIGEALAQGAPFATVLIADGMAAELPDGTPRAEEEALASVAGTIAEVERGGLVTGARGLATYFRERLDSLVRSDSALLTLWSSQLAARIAFKKTSAAYMKRKLCERGVLVELDADGGAVAIAPPLIIRPAEIDVIIGTVRGALHNTPVGRLGVCCAACEAIGPAY